MLCSIVDKVANFLFLDAESKLGCAELRIFQVQASHGGAPASTPTGPQATPSAAQGTPACSQATPSHHQEGGCMEGSTTDTEHVVVQGNKDRQSTAADVVQETADSDAAHQVGFAVVPTTSDCSMTGCGYTCVHVKAVLTAESCTLCSKLYSVLKDTASSTLICHQCWQKKKRQAKGNVA